MRGTLHWYAAWVTAGMSATLAALAPTGTARGAALVYGAGLTVLFGASGVYHRWKGCPRWKQRLRRLDHSMIFLAIGTSYTTLALLVLESPLPVLIVVWPAVLGGVAFSVAWIDAPRMLHAAAYVVAGWLPPAAVPELPAVIGTTACLLFAAGGLVCSLGAIVYTTQRPDPWPATFGFHEVFHALIVVGIGLHIAGTVGLILA
jgi:hemolysin III